MPESTTTNAEQWTKKVDEFIIENDDLLADFELEPEALSRLLLHATNMLADLISDTAEAANVYAAAQNVLADMINDSYCSAWKINEQKKHTRVLGAEHESLKATQERLMDFRREAATIFDKGYVLDEKPAIVPIEEPKPLFWQRLFGTH